MCFVGANGGVLNPAQGVIESFLKEGTAFSRASQVAPVVKNPPANAGEVRDAGSIPGSGRSSGGGKGTPLQYSCLENPMDREAWQATVHRITESDKTEAT